MERESHISRNEPHESLKIPRELMERFTNMTNLNLSIFLSASQLRLVSNPVVCSKTYNFFPLYEEVDLGTDCLLL